MKTKTKTIEVPELSCKITIEWQEKEDQLELSLHGTQMSLHDVEQEVVGIVIGPVDSVHLADECRLQHVKDARHVFCSVARFYYGFSVAAIAKYLRRGSDTVRHSLRKVKNASKTQDPSLNAAYLRWENS